MAPKSLELKVLSCKDIKAFNFFQKLSIYASVSLIIQDRRTKKSTQKYQQQKTSVDREGDGNPEWKHQMKFDLHQFSSSSLDSLFLEFDLLSEGVVFDKSIACVRVPLKELLQGSNGGAVRFMSYQAVTADGQPNGVLDFSYKVFDDMPATDYISATPYVIHPSQSQAVVDLSPSESNQFYYPLQDQGVYPPPPLSSVYPPPPAVPPYVYPPPSAVSSFAYPPPPAVSQSVYPPVPMPYGQASGEFNSQAYPAVDPFRPYYGDSWQKDVQPWNVR